MKLSTKLYLGFGALVMLLILNSAFSIFNFNTIKHENGNSTKYAEYEEFITEKVVDHYKWVGKLDSLFLNNLETIDIQTDHTQCSLGSFIYGEEARSLAESDNDFSKHMSGILDPHEALHKSAVSILDVWKKRHAGLSLILKDRLDDHRKWAINLSAAIIDRNPNISIELDPSHCGFGLFLASEQSAEYAREFSEYKTIMQKVRIPHATLHASAEKVLAALKAGDFDGSLQVYEDETLKSLDKIDNYFKQIISAEDTLESAQKTAMNILDTDTDEALSETQAALFQLKDYLAEKNKESKTSLLSALSSTEFFTIAIAIAAIILGSLASVFIVRSITLPINAAINSLSLGSTQVSAASGQVASTSQSLAEGSSEQASSLEEVSSSLEEMAAMTSQNVENTNQAAVLAQEASGIATNGREAMKRMEDAINKIKTSSDETAKILKTIDEIAFQTNLLALNAAVEAARAGEAGKGFAVVAEEVRSLAQRSAEAAKSTSALIDESKNNANNGVIASREVMDILLKIDESTDNVEHLIGEVKAASEEQSEGVNQLNIAVSQIDIVTQSNAAHAEESASASEELSSQASEMQNIVENLIEIVGRVDSHNSIKSSIAPAQNRLALGSQTLSSGRAAGKPGFIGTEQMNSFTGSKGKNQAHSDSKAHTIAPEQVIPLDNAELEDF